MTVSQVLERKDAITTMPVGVGANPIDRWFVDECGDTYLWTSIDEFFSVRLESL
jgi:hypothetical protein